MNTKIQPSFHLSDSNTGFVPYHKQFPAKLAKEPGYIFNPLVEKMIKTNHSEFYERFAKEQQGGTQGSKGPKPQPYRGQKSPEEHLGLLFHKQDKIFHRQTGQKVRTWRKSRKKGRRSPGLRGEIRELKEEMRSQDKVFYKTIN
jgi:hypothetical protein